ncbi:protein executer 2, chloroplastic [Podospora fimiseda]|uniref:Protein executer 2, chloroplastic n=1 Tax=Podospora fimiseda TaxID=252190 RepID=A0AAN7BPY1_9PEZI|nr:protein executer 2, chloroplastic [Podospora fimiseda]
MAALHLLLRDTYRFGFMVLENEVEAMVPTPEVGIEPPKKTARVGFDSSLSRIPQSSTCYLLLLPTELVLAILSYLSPIDVVAVSVTCCTLHTHATTDLLWQGFIQDNVPGQKITKPYPCPNFRALYQAHDTRWCLPRYKIWVSDKDLTGRLVIIRFDQRRGCIEGYQLVAFSKQRAMQPWEAEPSIRIHSFEPEVYLHLDKPILELHAVSSQETNAIYRERVMTRLIRAMRDGQYALINDEPVAGFPAYMLPETQPAVGRFEAEVPMNMFGPNSATFCSYMPARALSPVELQSQATGSFPYGNVWPPPTIPASEYFMGAGPRARGHGDEPLFRAEHRPTRRSEVSELAFHTRKFLTHPFPIIAREENNTDTPSPAANSSGTNSGPSVPPRSNRAIYIPFHEVTTYATLDPKLYTPTKDKPFRGIWVGDYSGHGCEFLLMTQPDNDEETQLESPKSKEGETDEDYEKRKYEQRIYRGSLEAIKLTGDPNIPRGELTFRVDDLGPEAYVRTIQDEPFKGARVVKSMGHIADNGFQHDQFIESQLFILSHDRLAQYWIEWGHISYFERVNIDDFLVPR